MNFATADVKAGSGVSTDPLPVLATVVEAVAMKILEISLPGYDEGDGGGDG